MGEMSEPVYHAVARCRWCGGKFVRVYDLQWLCETPACAARQISHARKKHPDREDPTDGASPYLFLPLPLGVELSENTTKRLLIEGPRGTGKSVTGRWHLYSEAEKYPGYTALLLRCTLDQLWKNHLMFVEQELELLGGKEHAVWKERPVRHVRFANGSQIIMGYCQDKSDIGQHIGPEYDEILLEEGVQLITEALEKIPTSDRGSASAREVLAKVGRRTGRTRILTNPHGPSLSHLRDFYKNKNPDAAQYRHYNPEFYDSMTSTILDNPYASETYAAEAFGGLNSSLHAQLAEGRWDVFPGQFFSDFDPTVHVQESL
jgi:hypothetical protein